MYRIGIDLGGTNIAAGLVGEGSECLGFDDDISTDHDFGPAFCIWVPEWLYQQAGAELKSAYDSLPAEYHGYRRIPSAQGGIPALHTSAVIILSCLCHDSASRC